MAGGLFGEELGDLSQYVLAKGLLGSCFRLSYLFSQWVLDLKMARIWELSKGFYRGGNPEAPAQTFVLLVDCRVKSTLVQFLY